MNYIIISIVLFVLFVAVSRIIIRRKAEKFIFNVALPAIVTEQFQEEEIGYIASYIGAHQHDIFNNFAHENLLGMYGAKIALARLNIVQGLSNSDEVLKDLEGVTGEELLVKLKEYILMVEKYKNKISQEV